MYVPLPPVAAVAVSGVGVAPLQITCEELTIGATCCGYKTTVEVVALLQAFGAEAVTVKVTVIGEAVVFVIAPFILPLPDKGMAVVRPAGLSLVQLMDVPATLFGFERVICVILFP